MNPLDGSRTLKITAYGVHLLTAIGAALGLWAIILTLNGYFKEAIWVMGVAVFVDSIDGTLARYVNAGEKAPVIDGALLDNIIDFVTWTIAPLVWIYAIMQIPEWVLMVCAVASAFGFSNTQAKTSDHFFLGFPSYWNIVVFYLYMLQLSVPFSSAILLVFAVCTLLPIKFVYPTRTDTLKVFTLALGTVFALQLVGMMILFDETPILLTYSSFLFPVYYFSLSFYLNLKSI